MVPRQTTPLAKAVRTLEGVLLTGTAVVSAAASAIDPHQLPPKYAAVLATVASVALGVQRTVLKVKSLGYVQNVVSSPDPLKEILAEVEAASGAETPARTRTPVVEVGPPA